MSTPSEHLKEHIEIIAKHEEEFLARRTRPERVGDALGAFTGSLWFIGLQAAAIFLWILLNSLHSDRFRPFDPWPFPMLDTVVAIEAIFLASFIMMRQSRLSRRSDEREHLMLQVLILTEKEVTAVLQIQRQLASNAGLTDRPKDEHLAQLSQETSIDDVARTIRASLPVD